MGSDPVTGSGAGGFRPSGSGLSAALVSVAGGWPRTGSGPFPWSRASSASSRSSVWFHSISQTPASCTKVRRWACGGGGPSWGSCRRPPRPQHPSPHTLICRGPASGTSCCEPRTRHAAKQISGGSPGASRPLGREAGAPTPSLPPSFSPPHRLFRGAESSQNSPGWRPTVPLMPSALGQLAQWGPGHPPSSPLHLPHPPQLASLPQQHTDPRASCCRCPPPSQAPTNRAPRWCTWYG